MIAGRNDTVEEAKALATLLKNAFRDTGAPIHVNLIRVNEVEETGMRAGTQDSANRFAETLNRLGVVATVRRRLGSDINGACGQLRRSSTKSESYPLR